MKSTIGSIGRYIIYENSKTSELVAIEAEAIKLSQSKNANKNSTLIGYAMASEDSSDAIGIDFSRTNTIKQKDLDVLWQRVGKI